MSDPSYTKIAPRQTIGGRTTRTQTVTASGDLVKRDATEQTVATQRPVVQATPVRKETPQEKWARKFGNVQLGVAEVSIKGNSMSSGGNADFRVEGVAGAFADVEKNKFKVQKDMTWKLRGARAKAAFGDDPDDDPDAANTMEIGGRQAYEVVATGVPDTPQQVLQQALKAVDQAVSVAQTADTAGRQTIVTTEQAFPSPVAAAPIPAPVVAPEQKKGLWASWFGRKK